jgi:cobyrinic acid a,c-diamide synthase
LAFCYNGCIEQQGAAMSKMGELAMDIECLLNQGKSFAQVAQELEIPVHFVVEAAEISQSEEFSPHITVNS